MGKRSTRSPALSAGRGVVFNRFLMELILPAPGPGGLDRCPVGAYMDGTMGRALENDFG